MAPAARRFTALRERTHEAARGRRCARRRAELHQALVEITRCVLGWQRAHQLARERPQCLVTRRRLDVLGHRENAGEHTGDIAVDERRAFAKCDRCDRAGRVWTDAGHGSQLRRRRGQGAAELLAHRLRTRVEVARARVVAKPGPCREHIVERCRRERVHRRKALHPALPIRNHRLDARLLQHDLADPDRVRVTRATPREIAAVTRVVRDDGSRDLAVFHPSIIQVQHRKHARREDESDLGRTRLVRHVCGGLLLARRIIEQVVRHVEAQLPVL